MSLLLLLLELIISMLKELLLMLPTLPLQSLLQLLMLPMLLLFQLSPLLPMLQLLLLWLMLPMLLFLLSQPLLQLTMDLLPILTELLSLLMSQLLLRPELLTCLLLLLWVTRGHCHQPTNQVVCYVMNWEHVKLRGFCYTTIKLYFGNKFSCWCLSTHDCWYSHVEGSLSLLRLESHALACLSYQPQWLHPRSALQLDHGPGQLLAHPPLPLGQPRLQDVEDDHVLSTQLRLPLQILLGHWIKPNYHNDDDDDLHLTRSN